MRMTRVVAVLGMIAVLASALQAAAQSNKMKPSIVDQAKAYCTATGGVVELRHAVYGTNNPQQDWL